MSAQATLESLWAKAVNAVNATFTYEELILQISPLCLVLAISPFFLRHYSLAPVYLRRSPFPRFKLASAGTLICLEFSNLIFRRVRLDTQADTMVAAALIDLVAALTIGIILYIEQRHGIRASSFLSLYLLAGCLIDAAKFHLFFLELGLTSAGLVAAAAGGIRLTLLALELVLKKLPVVSESVHVTVGDEAENEQEKSRPYFVFPSPFIPRQLRISIKNGNLMPIPDEFASDRLHAKLRSYWERDENVSAELAKKRRLAQVDGRPPPKLDLESLVMTCAEIWETELRRMLAPRLIFATCTFSQPFLLKAVIDVIRQDDVSILNKVILVIVTALVFVGVTLSKSAYAHMNYLMVTRLRGSFITQIIDKTHRISFKQARLSASVSLMSRDIDGIAVSMPRVIELPITLIETCFGIYFLSFFIGSSSFLVVAPVLVSNVFSWFWGFATGPALDAWNKSAEARVAKTSSILLQITAIKTMGLGPIIGDFLQRLRQDEIKLSKRYRALETVTIPLVQFANLMTPVVLVGRALSKNSFGDPISANAIFPTLALIAAIQGPLGRLLDTYSTITSLLDCFDRIQEFLSLPERDEYRYIMNKPPPTNRRISPTHERHVHPVEMVDVDIAPSEVRQPILFRLDFSLVQGSITAIIGAPGTGKSTLLQGMLGEASLVEGAVCIQNEEMAVCGQETWLQDVSILDNIIGPLPYNADFFKRVVNCCLLQHDLQRLPGGADYMVGPGGKHLSGGQRQRIGIARTVYARTAVMLFDDPFSLLDRKTAVSIIFHLFGASGLLREMGITVALVTYLRESLDVADRVLLLDGRGYAALEDQPFQTPAFAASVHNLFNSIQDGPSEEIEDVEKEVIRRSLEFEKLSQKAHQRVMVTAPTGGESRSPATKGTDNVRRSTLYLKPIGYFSVALYTLLILCFSMGEHVPSIYTRVWIDICSDNVGFFKGYASAAGITCLIGTLSYWLLFVKLAPRAALDLHRRLVNAITGSTLTFLGVVNMGSVLTQFDQDAGQISRQLPFYAMRTAHSLFSIIIKTSVILSGISYFVAVLPLIVAALYHIQKFYFETARELRQLELEAKTPLFKRFEETADGIMYMRAFRWLKADTRISFGLLNISQRAFYYLYYFQQWLVVVLGLLTSSVAVTLVLLALFFPRNTSEAAIGLSFLTLTQFSWTLERLFEVLTLLETSTGALERLRTFLQRAPQEPERVATPAPEGWPARGDIEIEDVTASYGPNAETPALQNLTLFIEAGQRAGLIGRTGSGKTSVLNAILGLIEYTGTIKIDGVDLATLSRDEIRSRIITISQDQIRLDASIRVNLLPFTINNATTVAQADGAEPQQQQPPQGNAEVRQQDEMLGEILQRFGIWHQLVRKNGLDTMLDDAGYSPAEVQLLGIARAILRQRETNSKVVLVDEVTTSADFWAEGFVQDIMRESFAGCTLLVAAHREEAVLDASVVLEMSRGVIMHAARRDGD